MASGSSGSWWSSLIQTAKEKSLNAIELIKTDLNEFTTTMKNDIYEVSSQLQDNSLIDRVTTLHVSTQSNNNDKPTNKKDVKLNATTSSSIYDRFKNELVSLQNNQDTYLTDPLHNDYSDWRESFDPDSNKGLISDLLIENVTMRSLYSQLVPAVISNKDFWSRYFFRAKLVEDEHKKRTNLIEKATSKVNENSYEKLNWDEDGEEEWNKIDNFKKEPANTNNNQQLKEKLVVENNENSCAENINENKNIVNTNEEKNHIETEQSNEDKKLEDSDEWEKDFEISNEEKSSSSLLNVAESIKGKFLEKDKTEILDCNKDDKENEENKEKNDEWESWD